MTPNVFLSSTVANLHYLRDALRDAIIDLAYRPVMSDYGEVGYIAPMSAAESCYRTVRQCQLVVLIIGRRYGDPDHEGLSVTHREFLAAQNAGIPIITFVEADVLSFKQVYDTDPSAELWNRFSGMDNPKGTFGLINLVRASEQFNGLLPLRTAGEAKQILKTQIAEFVADRLSDLVRPVRSDVQDLIAEVKGLRSEMRENGKSNASPEITRYTRALRFLLDDRSANFRKFIEQLFVDLDSAIPVLLETSNVAPLIEKSGRKVVIDADQSAAREAFSGGTTPSRFKCAHKGGDGFYGITKDREVVISPDQVANFEDLLRALKSRVNQVSV